MPRISTRPLPTPEQVAWADCEIGVIIHFDLQVFKADYEFRAQPPNHPSPAIFAPTALDTGQWIATTKAGGANYAMLVAKHGTGFSLWPTEAHDYSVKNSPWKGGGGDVVADFIASCAKYDVRPGLYYHCGCNGYCNADNPGRALSGTLEDQLRYNRIVEQQITELWTRYGKLFEIWFDGGTLRPELGGPEVEPKLHAYQPQAVCFQGPRGTRSNVVGRAMNSATSIIPAGAPRGGSPRASRSNTSTTRRQSTATPSSPSEKVCPGD